jgi:lysophosphatidylcholine acyltransferase/lyso-PAF acetyltransferase
LIEEDGHYPPLAIFPEGTTSNGTHIMPFKRGAFMSLRAVTPVIMKFRFGTISQAYDILPFLPLVLMNLCLCNFRIDITELPPFLPNDYLFENHENKLMKT